MGNFAARPATLANTGSGAGKSNSVMMKSLEHLVDAQLSMQGCVVDHDQIRGSADRSVANRYSTMRRHGQHVCFFESMLDVIDDDRSAALDDVQHRGGAAPLQTNLFARPKLERREAQRRQTLASCFRVHVGKVDRVID